MEKLTIIDGSSLIYSACHNVSNKPDKTDNFSVYMQTLDYYLDKILEVTNAKKYIIFGDGSSSYRKRIFDTFKSDRIIKAQYTKFKYDLLYYAREKWKVFSHPDLESDDMCIITHNQFKDEYDITIAAIDGDLRQYPAKFFNYGIFRKKDYKIEDGFEIITPEQAEFNLWKFVLIKGHNNKVDYLENCGEGTAETYLKKYHLPQYKYAVMRAYIEGLTDIRKSVTGYGLCQGIDKFNKSFKQTYLFRTQDEINELGITFGIPEFKIRHNGREDEVNF